MDDEKKEFESDNSEEQTNDMSSEESTQESDTPTSETGDASSEPTPEPEPEPVPAPAPVASVDEDEDEDEDYEPVTVKQVSIKWGLINAVVGIAVFLALAFTGLIYDSSVNWIGIIPFIAILVLAHKEFNEEGNGYMSYSQGLGIGTLMALISSIITGVFNYIYTTIIDTEYYQKQREFLISQWEQQGMSDAEIETALGFMSNFENPALGIVLQIVFGVFFAFLISLIVAAITKKNNPDMEI